MTTRARFLLLVVLAVLPLAACGGAPAEPVTVSPPPPDKARLYVYRSSTIYGFQAWTAVSLNRVKIGDSAPGTAFVRDVPPGTYEITVKSDNLYPNQFKTVRLDPGSITFVKIQDQPDWSKSGFGAVRTTFVVTIVSPAFAAAELSSVRLVPG
jgi:hypothetical protein